MNTVRGTVTIVQERRMTKIVLAGRAAMDLHARRDVESAVT
jgi:hypothetical protein